MKEKLLLKQRLITVVGICIILTNVGCQQNVVQSEVDKQEQITTLYHKYAKEFPQVEGIAVEKLQHWQQQGKNIILVDVRSPEERAVSVIRGAISKEEFERDLEHYRSSDALIIAYCTIGYRSGRYAQKLRQQGINILNLKGSLLAWSHIRGELFDAAGATNKIHVYSRQWQLIADNYQPVW